MAIGKKCAIAMAGGRGTTEGGTTEGIATIVGDRSPPPIR